jgi:hypothetical protein
MELTDFLDDFVDPEFKNRLRDVTSDRLADVLTDALAKSEARQSDAEVAKLAEERLLRDKGWHAMWASTGLTDIHHQGQSPGKDVQNGDHGEEEAASAALVHFRVQG